MKRILFVDDENLILRGLERSLYLMNEQWELAFTDSGEKALRLMAGAQFDVIVADMRMPGMNGAELLNEVMQRYPRTVRLILSGHADNDLILKCVGSTHQYLRKPCDVEELMTTIERAMSLESTLRSATLRALASSMDCLPTLPSLYVEIIEKLESSEAPLEGIGEIVARDIGMTAKLLKLVNSAFFGLHRQVADPLEAVTYLGVDTLKSLVLTVHVFAQFDNAEASGLAVGELWFHSMQTAAAAKAIAQAEQADSKLVNEAFTAGLLHDCGKLVLAGNLGSQYREVLRRAGEHSLPLLDAERHVFGANHAEVGSYLLGLWGLPVPIVEAIALHHHPSQSSQKTFTPLTAVHVGNVLAWEASGRSSDEPGRQLDLDYLDKLGLATRLPEWRGRVAGALNERVAA